jgi:hypothetical protein
MLEMCLTFIDSKKVTTNEFNNNLNSIASNLNKEISDATMVGSKMKSLKNYQALPNISSIFINDCNHLVILEIIS